MLTAVIASLFIAPAQGIPAHRILHHERFELENGLTVIVHEDSTAPVVALHVWYHVGSKNERPGATGLAHLFEHLMFQGSAHYDSSYFAPLQRVGALIGGGTNPDRTSYHQTVPTAALDLALFLESDRMGHLLDALTQAKLDEQRGVVINEVRQGMNSPYGRQFDVLTQHAYPHGHGYSWPTAGSLEDVQNASLEDARQWFRTHYGARNTVLVLAGDIDVATAREKVQRYFGDISPGPMRTRRTMAIEPLSVDRRSVQEDGAAHPRFVRVWNVPGYSSRASAHLALLAMIVGGDASSRLQRRLIDREALATSIVVNIQEHEIGSQFYIRANVRDPSMLARVESVVDEEIGRVLQFAPSNAELARAKARMRVEFLRRAETVGGPDGRAEMLAAGEAFTGNAAFEEERLGYSLAAEPSTILGVAREWLSRGSLTLHIRPAMRTAAATTGVDRSRLPTVSVRIGSTPQLEVATLSNGLRLAVVHRPAATITELRLQFDGSALTDPVAQRGRTALAMELLRETAEEVAASNPGAEGMEIESHVTHALAFLRISVPSADYERAMTTMAAAVSQQRTDPRRLEHHRGLLLSRIAEEERNDATLGRRVMPALLCGAQSNDGIPWTGLGDSLSIAQLSEADLRGHLATEFVPTRATVIIVGATTIERARRDAEKAFAAWRGPASATRVLARCVEPRQRTVHLIHREGATQARIFGAVHLPPRSVQQDPSLQVFQQAFGAISGRLFANLREQKGWSYGAYADVEYSSTTPVLLMHAAVQMDRTAESLREMAREFDEVLTTRPLTDVEIGEASAFLSLSTPVRLEPSFAMADAVSDIVMGRLAQNYLALSVHGVRASTPDHIRSTIAEMFRNRPVVWLVIADFRLTAEALRAAGLGPVVLIDETGSRVVNR